MKVIEPSIPLEHTEKHEEHIGKCKGMWIHFNSFEKLLHMYKNRKKMIRKIRLELELVKKKEAEYDGDINAQT